MSSLTRHEALSLILSRLGAHDLALFTTGYISREAFGVQDRPQNFYMIGSMGLLSSVGLGLALQRPDRRVVVVEGDGSALMSLGTLALIGQTHPANLFHVVLDNEAYESTGEQPTITTSLNLAEVARACGYSQVALIRDGEALHLALDNLLSQPGPAFFLLKTALGGQEAPRVSMDPPALSHRFRDAVMGYEP